MLSPSSTFEIGGHTYSGGRLTTFQQLHVARLFAPVLIRLVMTAAKDDDEQSRPENVARVMIMAANPLPPEDMDQVVNTCLSTVQRSNDKGGYSALVVPGAGLMFQDVELLELMMIVHRVLERSGLLDFFAAGPSK